MRSSVILACSLLAAGLIGAAPAAAAPSASPTPSPVLFDGARLADWPVVQTAGPDRVREVRDPLGSRARVLRFTARGGDVAPLTPTENPRAQLLTPPVAAPGRAFWLSYEVRLPPSFPVAETRPPERWIALGSPYFGRPFNGSPATGIVISGGELAYIRNHLAPVKRQRVWSTPLVLDRWLRVSWHVKPAADGWVELYYRGRQVRLRDPTGRLVRRLKMAVIDATNHLGPNTAQLSIYYGKGQFSALTMDFKGFTIARTRAAAER